MTRRAGIYVRISSDPKGRRLGVTRQTSACRKKAQEKGWSVVEVYEDNDVSAFTGKKPRPAYERMLADLEVGRIDAVVVWDLDRLTRRPIEVEHFIDLADRTGAALASVGGDMDLSTENGRMFARITGAVARQEIEHRSRRQREANDQRASQGRPHAGRRAYGYSANGMELVEAEAAEVRSTAEALVGGASLRSIVASMNERGATTTAGNGWKPTELRRVLANPRYAGLRTHRGAVVGEAQWPAILDQETWGAVQAILSDPARRKAGPPRRYLLSGLARCQVCGAKVYGTSEKRGPLYMCETRSHVVRRAEQIDELVAEVVAQRLAEPDAADLLARPGDQARTAELRGQEAGLRTRLDGLAEAFASGDIDRQQLTKGSARLRGELEVVTAELSSLARVPVLADLLGAEDVRQVWDDMDLDRQRTVVDTLVDITIGPAGRGARSFDPSTIEWAWKG